MRFVTSVPDAIYISTYEEALALARYLLTKPTGFETRLALDTETTGLNIMKDFPVFWSLSDGKDRWCLTSELLVGDIFDLLFNDVNRWWVFANAKYDLHMLANFGKHIAGPALDIIVMCWLIDENRKNRAGLGLKEQTRDICGYNMKSFKDTFNIKSESDIAIEMLTAPTHIVANYASGDAYWTWVLSEDHANTLRDLPFFASYSGWDYYIDIEVPFTKTLWRMERRGFPIDAEYLLSLRPSLEQKVITCQEEINHWAGRPINVSSPKQLQKLLYDDLGLTPVKWTKGGTTGNQQPSTDEETLDIYAEQGIPQVQKIVEYRQAKKLIGTYIDGIIEKLHNGRVHCTMNQTGTDTGRLAVNDPNLQNIPAKSEEGKKIRGAFVASRGNKLLVYDYSQVEMRLMAHMSGDPKMISAIRNDLDLHCFTVGEMMNKPYSHAVCAKIVDDQKGVEDLEYAVKKAIKATKASAEPLNETDAITLVKQLYAAPDYVHEMINLRKAAKAVGFGLIYGIGPSKLAGELMTTKQNAADKIEQYFRVFPYVKKFIDTTKATTKARSDHTVQTLLGRHRRLTMINSRNRMISSQEERRCVNVLAQGGASDIARLAMNSIDQDPLLGGGRLEGGELGIQMLLQIHDEIIQDCPDNEDALRIGAERTKYIMSNPGIELSVPLEVSGGSAESWLHAK